MEESPAQVDQEWPLVCHLFALVSHSRIQKCWRVWHFFYTFFRLIHTSCGISALFDTSLHGSVMKCFHSLYTYYTVSTLPVRLSVDLSDTPWVTVPFKKCKEVYTYSALLIDLGSWKCTLLGNLKMPPMAACRWKSAGNPIDSALVNQNLKKATRA